MSKHEDLANDVLERLEYSDSKQDATPPVSYTHLDVYKRQQAIRERAAARATVR